MSEDRAKGRLYREIQQPRTGPSRTRAEGLEPRERTDLQNKNFWGVRGLLRDGLRLTLTLNVMSREDSRDLGLNPAVSLTSWMSLGNLPGL